MLTGLDYWTPYAKVCMESEVTCHLVVVVVAAMQPYLGKGCLQTSQALIVTLTPNFPDTCLL